MTQIKITNENTVEVQDATGRTLRLNRPNALAQYRLVDALGASAENRVYLGMTIPLIYLTAIDGEQVAQPTSKLQIEALIQRLDEDGLMALNDGIAANFSRDKAEEVASAKKSQPIPDSDKS